MLVMHRIRKERRPTNKKSKVYFPSFSYDVFCSLFLQRTVQYLISVFPCCSVFFPIYGRKYSMKANLFMENMWEFSLCFFLAPYKVNIPMYAGEFFLCFFSVPYKVNILMYAGGFKQVQYKEYIWWIQVKIHISDQTSLRICNSVLFTIFSLENKVVKIFLFVWRKNQCFYTAAEQNRITRAGRLYDQVTAMNY